VSDSAQDDAAPSARPGPGRVAFKLPGNTERTAIIGKTGSGKTQAGVWLLSTRDLTARPWVAIDFKRDKLLNSLPGARELGLLDAAPKRPGLYLVHPMPGDGEALEALLWRIWEKGKIGVFVDESYMIDRDSEALQALLTQGRSKQIPMILATQRPVHVSRFAFSEADYIQLFRLTDKRDLQTVSAFMPGKLSVLPPFHSHWYDNGRDYRCILQPVPSADTLRNSVAAQIGPRRPYY
jgi:DNA helicase HerA-like ATPase